MFTTNKENPSSNSINMEIESMENDLIGEKPIREEVKIKNEKDIPRLKKTMADPKQQVVFDKKKFTSVKNIPGKEEKKIISKKFIPLEKKPYQKPFSQLIPTNKEELKKEKIQKIDNQKNKLDNVLNKKNTPTNKIKKETDSKFRNKINWFIISIAVLTFFIASLSGTYYYFFVFKKTVNFSASTINKEITSLEKETSKENNNGITRIIPPTLEECEKTELKEKNIFETIKSISSEKINISEGKVFAISENSNILDATTLISKLNIKLSEQIITNFDKGWLFLKKLEGENIRIGLLLEIKDSGKIDFLKTSILRTEKELPEAFDTLYLEDQIPIYEPENISFSNSLLYDNFRYFNFYPEKTNPSLDWGIRKYQKDDQTNDFVIFSTSRELTKNIIDLFNY
jgi:hypothetical protein